MAEFKFSLENIFTRRMDYDFIPGDMPENIAQAARVEVTILSETSASVLLGMQVNSDKPEIENDDAIFSCTVEVVAILNFENPLPRIEDPKKFPLLPNIMGIIFPFVRERISSALASSNLPITIDPLNMHATLGELTDAVEIFDNRETQPNSEEVK